MGVEDHSFPASPPSTTKIAPVVNDDREDTIRHRLEVYADQTSPLIGYYGDRGLLRGVDATGPVEDVTERAINALRRFGD